MNHLRTFLCLSFCILPFFSFSSQLISADDNNISARLAVLEAEQKNASNSMRHEIQTLKEHNKELIDLKMQRISLENDKELRDHYEASLDKLKRVFDDEKEALNARADSIDNWLSLLTGISGVIGLFLTIIGIWGIKEFHEMRKEIFKMKAEAEESLGHIKSNKTKSDELLAAMPKSSEEMEKDKDQFLYDKLNEIISAPEIDIKQKRFAQAYKAQSEKKYKEAFSEWESILHDKTLSLTNEDRAQIYFNMAYLKSLISEIDAAIQLYTQSIDLWPHVGSFNNRGILYYDKSLFEKALSDYNKALNLEPKDADIYVNRGNLYSEQGERGKALFDYNKALELEPKNADIYVNRGNLYSEQGECEKALFDYNKALELEPKNADIYVNRGVLFYKQRECEKALSDYNKALELEPQNTNSYINRGNLYSEQGECEKALSDYNKVLELEPKNATIFANRGVLFYKQREYEKALSDYNKTLELEPKDATTFANRGNLYSKQRECEKALSDYNKALELEPRNTNAYLNRGNLLFEQGECEKALFDYNKALELDPKNAAIYGNRGNLYSAMKDFDKATQDYDKALTLDIHNSDLKVNVLEFFLVSENTIRFKDLLEELLTLSSEKKLSESEHYQFLYISILHKIAKGKSFAEEKTQFDELSKKDDFIFTWNNDAIDSWFKENDKLNPEQRKQIQDIIEVFKKHLQK